MSRSGDLKKLKDYARSKKVKVRFRSKFPLGGIFLNGTYNIPNRTVTLSSDFKKKKCRHHRLIYTLAHELGHAADFDKMGKRVHYRTVQSVGVFVMWCMGEIYIPKKYLRILRRIIVDMEERAYDEGEKILRRLKIEVPAKWAALNRKRSVGSYRRAFSRYLD